MRVNAPALRVSLTWGQPLTLAEGEGTCITSRRGKVWITQDHDLRDVVLSDGESFRLDRPDLAIVQAFDTAEVFVRPPERPGPAAAPAGLPQRLMLALRRGPRTAAADAR